MFSVRILNEFDYDILVKWWKQWRWSAPPRDFLPQDGTGGLMIEKDGINIVAGFIYMTNSKVSWSEYIISNFEYKEKDREEAIKILIQELSRVAKEMGAKYIFTSVKNPKLIKHYEEMGYVCGSKNTTEMYMML